MLMIDEFLGKGKSQYNAHQIRIGPTYLAKEGFLVLERNISHHVKADEYVLLQLM